MAAAPLPDVPMIVIARDKADQLPGPPMDAATIQQAEQIWRAAQAELASQVSDGTLIVATGSGHSIQFDQPQVVIDAIRAILDKVRQ
jgi:pimeloyl-ACP methyl ester carboxylesterase